MKSRKFAVKLLKRRIMDATLNFSIPVDNVPASYPLDRLKEQLTEYAKKLIAKYKAEVLSEENLKQAFPEDLMDKVAEYAIKECEAGNCIPNSQVKDNILSRLGWKNAK